MLTSQDLVNIIGALFVALFGWVLRTAWQEIKSLQEKDAKLSGDVAEIRVLVAGNYITKEEFSDMMKAIFSKLDRIEDKVGNKVDKN